MYRANTNPILNTRMNQGDFTGGKIIELATNVIAEPMYIQCHVDGNEYLILDALVDNYKDNKTISLTEQQTRIWGRPITHKTAAAWQICCQWKVSSISWEKLSELRNYLLVQTTEFASVQEIDCEPVLNGWIKHEDKKRERIIAGIRNQ